MEVARDRSGPDRSPPLCDRGAKRSGRARRPGRVVLVRGHEDGRGPGIANGDEPPQHVLTHAASLGALDEHHVLASHRPVGERTREVLRAGQKNEPARGPTSFVGTEERRDVTPEGEVARAPRER